MSEAMTFDVDRSNSRQLRDWDGEHGSYDSAAYRKELEAALGVCERLVAGIRRVDLPKLAVGVADAGGDGRAGEPLPFTVDDAAGHARGRDDRMHRDCRRPSRSSADRDSPGPRDQTRCRDRASE